MPTTQKYLNLSILFFFIAAILFFAGCTPPPKVEKKEQPPPPPVEKPVVKKTPVYDVSFRIASLDLSQPRSFKIEQQHIDQLAAIINKDSIDFLTVQGVARYPGLTTRVDIVDAISKATGMTNVFGENLTISGRQTGNVVYSRYPVLSHENTHYDKISSSNYESALQAVIDCGAREIVVISTLLPPKAPQADIMSCMGTLEGFHTYYINDPVIVSGNLPFDETKSQYASYTDTRVSRTAGTPRIWYASANEAMKLFRTKTISSQIGTLSVADFGLLRK